MHIPLSEFELLIPPHILERGLDYYEQGRVHDLRPDGEGMVLANVQGTDLYEVTMQVQKSILKFAECTCSYDKGGVCKHVTAVLFAINEGEFKEGVEGTKAKRKAAAASKKPAKAKEPVTRKPGKTAKKVKLDTPGMVDAATQEELTTWLKGVLRENKALEKQFKASFQHYQPADSATEIRQRVKELVFVGAKLSGKALQTALNKIPAALGKWWERCEDALAANDPEQVSTICRIIFEEANALPEHPAASEVIGKAAAYLYKVAQSGLPPKPRERLRVWMEDLLIETPRWDVQPPDIYRAVLHMQPDHAAQAALVGGWNKLFGQFHFPRTHEQMMTEVIGMVLGQRALEGFKKENLHVFAFRKAHVAELMAQGKHTEAKDTILKGFSHQQGVLGQPSPWWAELVDHHTAIEDFEGRLETVMLGFLSNEHTAAGFQEQLKELVPPNDWIRVRDRLVARIPDQHYKMAIGLLLMDKDFPAMLKYLETQNIWAALSGGKHLKTLYPVEFAQCLLSVMDAEIRQRRDARCFEAYSEAMMHVETILGKTEADAFMNKMIEAYPSALGLHRALKGREKRQFNVGFR